MYICIYRHIGVYNIYIYIYVHIYVYIYTYVCVLINVYSSVDVFIHIKNMPACTDRFPAGAPHSPMNKSFAFGTSPRPSPKEYGVETRIHVSDAFFSPRMGAERHRISNLVKTGDRVLILFAGCGPLACMIAKPGWYVHAVCFIGGSCHAT